LLLPQARKHGYEGLVDEIVPHIARWPLTKSIEKLPLTRGRLGTGLKFFNWGAVFSRNYKSLAIKMPGMRSSARLSPESDLETFSGQLQSWNPLELRLIVENWFDMYGMPFLNRGVGL